MEQLISTYGIYRASLTSGADRIDPEFVVTVPHGKEPQGDENLHVKDGYVYHGTRIFQIAGKPVLVYALEEKVD